MLEAFSRNGELGHWPKPNRQDPQLQKLHRRHRQIATRILSLTSAIEHGPSTLEYQIICREMRSLCRRLLGLEKEYWQRSGNSGLPPTLQHLCGPDFSTSATLQDILDESFLTREEIGMEHVLHRPDTPPPNPQEGALDDPFTPDDIGGDADPVLPPNSKRQARLQGLLVHHGKEATVTADPETLVTELWENDDSRPLRHSLRSWKRAKPLCDTEGMIDGVLRRHQEGRP